MFHGTVAFLVLVAFAVAGSELRQWLGRRGVRAPALELLGYLVAGFLLGDRVLGLFPGDVLATLTVVVLLGLAWIGLMVGLQLDLRVIRQLKPWHRRAGTAVPMIVGGMLAVGGLAIGLSPVLSVALATLGMVASPSTLESLARSRPPADRAALRLLKLVMAFAGLPAIAVLAVASAVWSPVSTHTGGATPPWQLLVSSVGTALLMGYVLLVLIRGVQDRVNLLTILTGSVAGVAGAAAVLGVSPLPAGAWVGAVLMNRCAFPHRLLRVAHSLEHPLLVALLVVAGASWSGGELSWRVLLLMVPGRLAAVLVGGWLLAAWARRHGVSLVVGGLGWGLLPQGELAMGLLVAVLGVVEQTPGAFEAVVVAMVLNHAAGQLWTHRRLFATAPDRAAR